MIAEQKTFQEETAADVYACQLSRILKLGNAMLVGGEKSAVLLVKSCSFVKEVPINPDWLQIGWEKENVIFALTFRPYTEKGDNKTPKRKFLGVTLNLKSTELHGRPFFEKILDDVGSVDVFPDGDHLKITMRGKEDRTMILTTDGCINYSDRTMVLSL